MNFFHDLDSPSNFLSTSPLPQWTLTPSLFGKTGFTPYRTTEANPFDLSFSGTPQKSLTVEDVDFHPTTGGFPLLPRRKRALSSPAMTPGAGSGVNAFNMAFSDALQKKQKLESDDGSSIATSSIFGGSVRDYASSATSSAATPPDFKAFSTRGSYSSETYDDIAADVMVDAIQPSLSTLTPLAVGSATFASLPEPDLLVVTPVAGSRPTFKPFVFASNAAISSVLSRPPGFRQDATVSGDSIAPASTSLPPPPPPAVEPVVTKPKAKYNKKNKRSGSFDEAAHEEAKRLALLERNRLAASKSRRKKKEKVNYLESEASEIAAKNVTLQATALALREELLQLRKVLDFHDTCRCEHIGNYRHREKCGGGIPTIEKLSGRTVRVDYKNVPTMGSETDCMAEFAAGVGPDDIISAFGLPAMP